MSFLYLLEKIRNPFFDFIFSLITKMGEETVFLVFALVFFWCVSKREGYYMLISGLVGTVINQALKLIFKIPRPWVKDPSFTIVESARAEATGYSFPSGHTQNVSTTFGTVGRYSRRMWVRILTVAIIILVAGSRMYLGVHTPLDVGVSLAIGAVLVFSLYPLFSNEERFNKFMPYIAVASAILSLALLLFVFIMPSEGVDVENLASGRKNAATLFGCTLALIPVYFIDRKYVKFETDGKWYAQIIKLVLGLGVVLVIKALFKTPLNMLFGNEYVGRCVRYFLIVVFAGLVWPLTFKFFSNLRIKALDNLFGKKEKTE